MTDLHILYLPLHAAGWAESVCHGGSGGLCLALINNGVTGQLSAKPPGASAMARGDLPATQHRAHH